MKCPNCQTEVFDIYTTEQRIKDLYAANCILGWARDRIRILAEMYGDRLRLGSWSYGEPAGIEFLAMTLREIHDKMITVK